MRRLLTALVLLLVGASLPIHAIYAQPQPPTACPTGVTCATPATGPGPGTPQPPRPRAAPRSYTIFTDNGTGWREPVDRHPAPNPWHGFHVCGSPAASAYPWCVPRFWKRGEKRITGFSWEWLYYPAPPKPKGYWVYAQITAYTPVDTPPQPGMCYCTADGTPVQIGVGGTNPAGCASHLPFGTVVDIPGLWTVTIHDVGSPYPFCNWPPHIDVWMPYATMQFEETTFFQTGILCGCSLGYYHRVFIHF